VSFMQTVDTTQSVTLGILAEDWQRSLTAANMSPKTVKTYMEAVTGLDRFLASKGMPRSADAITREHVEAFVNDLLERWKPATANNRFRGLQQFWKWCAAEGEVKKSPMGNMKPPKLPETLPPVLTDDELRRLIATAEGNSFTQRRDMALMRVLLDTGARAAEIMNLTLDDVDRDLGEIVVTGKGNRERRVAYGKSTGHAIDRYLRSRQQHRHRGLPWLWIGERGRVTDSGLRQMLERRGAKSGVEHVHAHRFRHAAADAYLKRGGSDVNLEARMGWRSPSMIRRYAAANRLQRANDEHRRLAPGERV
jgi:site-specific recombinase XerD